MSVMNTPLSLRAFAVVALTVILSACGGSDRSDDPGAMQTDDMRLLGHRLQTGGDASGAADLYRRALQADPTDHAARQALADLLELHGDVAGAEAQYREALRYDPENLELLRGHGRALLRLGRAEDARAAYQKALQAEPEDRKSLNGLGIALDALNQHSAAQQVYKEALALKPGDPTTLNNLGRSYILSGAYADAVTLLEPYARDTSMPASLRQNLAEAYGMSGMAADAERMGRMDLTPDQVRKNLGWYKERRVKLSIVPKFAAQLGAFPTEAMAAVRVDDVKKVFATEAAGIVVTSAPEIKKAGSTPSFVVSATGFSKADKLRAFCGKLKKSGYECRMQTNPS